MEEAAAEDQWVAEALKSDEMSAEMLMLLFRHSKDELRISKASGAEMEIAVKWVVRKNRSRIGGEEYRLEWSKAAAASCGVVGGDGNMSSPTTPLDWITSSSQSQEGNDSSSLRRNRKQTSPSPALMFPVDSQRPKGHVGVVNKGGSTSCSRLNSNKKKKSSDEWRVEFGLQMKEREKLGKEREKMIKILAEEKRQNGFLRKLLEEMSSVKPLLPNNGGDIAAAADIACPRLPPDYHGNPVRLLGHVEELAAAKEQIIKDQLVACSSCDQPSTSSSPNSGHNPASPVLQMRTADINAVDYESSKCGVAALPDLNLPLEEALYVEFFS